MTVETTEDTKSKKKNKAAKKAETVTLEAGVFPFEFLPVKADNDLIHVDPRTLIQAPFDSRAADTAPDEDLVKSIKDQGVLQPVVVTPVRDRTTGETGYMLIAGRLRTKGSIINGLETIPAHVKEFTLIEAKYACYTENSARRSTSFWDRAMFFRDMRDNEGIKQQDIAARVGLSNPSISQHLSVFDLDERVQTLVAKGAFGDNCGTKVRELKAEKDPDAQYAIALKIVEQPANWTSDRVKLEVQRNVARAEARAEREAAKENGEETPVIRAPKYSPEKVAIIKKPVMISLLESVSLRVAKFKNSTGADAEIPEKYHAALALEVEKGRLKGIEEAAGLRKLTKAVVGDDGDKGKKSEE